jgi:hypothetical protein
MDKDNREFLSMDEYRRSVRFRPWRERAKKFWRVAKPVISKVGEITITIAKGFIKFTVRVVWPFIKGVARGAHKTFKSLAEKQKKEYDKKERQ